MSIVIIKPRAGNRSAQLVRSAYSKRLKRSIPVQIGKVSLVSGIQLEEGEVLTEQDMAKVQRWLDEANGARSTVTLDTIDAKLTQLLVGLGGAGGAGGAGAAGAAGPAVAPIAPVVAAQVTPVAAQAEAESALAGLDAALAAAMRELTDRVTALKSAGVRLSNQRHVGTTPAGTNALDQAQARANFIRIEVLPRFQETCKALGLMVTKMSRTGEKGAP